MMELIKKTHVIIAPSPLDDDPILYRRHRLLNYLKTLDDTSEIIWVSPLPSHLFSLLNNSIRTENIHGIVQMLVPDAKSFNSHIGLLQKKLRLMIRQFNESADKLILWYTCPAFSSLAELDIWDAIIYDCSDMWTKAEHLPSLKKKMIARSERRIANTAQLCFASANQLHDHLLSLGTDQVKLIENGVDLQRFIEVHKRNSTHSAKPVLGFVGGLKPWKIDFNLLLRIAEVRSDWEIILVGSTYEPMPEDYTSLINLPNVKQYDHVSHEQIPSYIQKFDVGILPYLSNDYNRGVFPLKFFEYLACGVPVVGCGLPSTLHYVEKQVFEHVSSAQPSSFIQACRRAIDTRYTNIERRLAISETQDWDVKFNLMWEQVQSVIKR